MGIVLRAMSVHGPDREVAEVYFDPNRQLIRGPSETGKSYIYDCLWYMLGGNDRPESFPLTNGYEEFRLRFSTSENEYEVRRALSGGGAVVYSRSVKSSEGHKLEQVDQDLGELLVDLCGASGKEILRNHSKRGAVTGDDLRHWSLWSQTDLPAKQASAGKGYSIAKHEAAFHLFLTGIDDSAIQLRKSAEDTQLARGELQAAESSLKRIEALMPEDLKRNDVEDALERVDAALSAMTSQYDERASALKELRVEISENSAKLRKAENDRNHSQSIIGRFELLDKKYSNDQARLAGTYEGISFFQELPIVDCPLCGTSAEVHLDPSDLRPAALNRYRQAMAAEAGKIGALRVGLLSALNHEKERYEHLKALTSELAIKFDILQNREATVLNNNIVEFSGNPKQLAHRRSELSEQLNYFDEVQHITAEIQRLKKKSERKRITVSRTSGELGRAVAKHAKELLNAWGFELIRSISLDDERCDLRIDDRSRLSYGAGVRGLYLSALNIALMEHALENRHPHLGIVVLDSPLKAYADPESTEELDVLPSTVVDRFYDWMSKWHGLGQIIILENEPIRKAVTAEVLKPINFTRIKGHGRYGFYPLRDGIENLQGHVENEG